MKCETCEQLFPDSEVKVRRGKRVCPRCFRTLAGAAVADSSGAVASSTPPVARQAEQTAHSTTGPSFRVDPSKFLYSGIEFITLEEATANQPWQHRLLSPKNQPIQGWEVGKPTEAGFFGVFPRTPGRSVFGAVPPQIAGIQGIPERPPFRPEKSTQFPCLSFLRTVFIYPLGKSDGIGKHSSRSASWQNGP